MGTLLWFGFQPTLYPQRAQAWRCRAKNLRAQALESVLEFGPWLFDLLGVWPWASHLMALLQFRQLFSRLL